MVTAIACVGAGPDRLQHARMAERRHVALLLQLEADLVDAARGIDREHQLQVDRGLRRRRRGDGEREHQRAEQGTPGPHDPDGDWSIFRTQPARTCSGAATGFPWKMQATK